MIRFIHTADIHLGAAPDAGCVWSGQRQQEIRDRFRDLISVCASQKPQLLLIAGDLFHRQPQKSELREVNALFASIPETRIVLIAGNHDYIRKDSFYRNFAFAENVIFLKSGEPERVEIPELDMAVYGFSYEKREITEPLYDTMRAGGDCTWHILLAHGGDAKHVPWHLPLLRDAGFNYIAAGHVHQMQELIPDLMYYPGSLEPTEYTQTGPHGYLAGTLYESGKAEITFVPFAAWKYEDMVLNVGPDSTQYLLERQAEQEMLKKDDRTIFRIRLRGQRNPELVLIPDRFLRLGKVIAAEDETGIALNLPELKEKYAGTIIEEYIAALEDREDFAGRMALEYGLAALLEEERSL